MPYFMLKKKKQEFRNDSLGFFSGPTNKAWQAWRTTNRPKKNIESLPKRGGLCLAAEALSLSTLLISSTCADASLENWGVDVIPFKSLGIGRLTNQLILEIPKQNPKSNKTLKDSMNYEYSDGYLGIQFPSNIQLGALKNSHGHICFHIYIRAEDWRNYCFQKTISNVFKFLVIVQL